MDKTVGIYCILNTENMKLYVGQSKNISERLYKHRWLLASDKYKDTELLQKDYDIFGKDCFEYYILEYCEKSELSWKEVQYIAELKSHYLLWGYNKDGGGKNFRNWRK